MTERYLKVQRVAVIGAGASGVASAVHLTRAGLDVTVFERAGKAGGVWVFDERKPHDASYPSIWPSVGDMPNLGLVGAKDSFVRPRHDSPLEEMGVESVDPSIDFAPPGPAYLGLRNNVSTIEMEMQCHSWNPGTEEFVSHAVLAEYIQSAAAANGVIDRIQFNTRVAKVVKDGQHWEIATETLDRENSQSLRAATQRFDAIVVATGHYWAPSIPNIPGLSDWKRSFPDCVQHSKRYRSPEQYGDQNVLLIGGGVSSIDIAKELGPIAKTIFQSTRNGTYDLPSHLLPDNAARVGGIEAFTLEGDILQQNGSIPGTVKLKSGEQVSNLHKVIVATGYHVSYPFMRQFHADGVLAADADERVIVTSGQQTHNLHKDIWYIPDPTLAFVGVPYHVATFSFFEFQAMVVAAVFAGSVALPDEAEMRRLYNDRLAEKGAGRDFHSLGKAGLETAYVEDVIAMMNAGKGNISGRRVSGHSPNFMAAYELRRERKRLLFSKERDPSIQQTLLAAFTGWR